MSQRDKLTRARDAAETLRKIAAVRPLFAVEARRLRELERGLAKHDALARTLETHRETLVVLAKR